MMLKEKICCLWTLFCLVTSKPPRVPFITDKSFIDECVQSHNEFRSRVDPPAADMKQVVRKNSARPFSLVLSSIVWDSIVYSI